MKLFKTLPVVGLGFLAAATPAVAKQQSIKGLVKGCDALTNELNQFMDTATKFNPYKAEDIAAIQSSHNKLEKAQNAFYTNLLDSQKTLSREEALGSKAFHDLEECIHRNTEHALGKFAQAFDETFRQMNGKEHKVSANKPTPSTKLPQPSHAEL